MSLIKHIFRDGKHLASAEDSPYKAIAVVYEGGVLDLDDEDLVIVKNLVREYPWPIKLEENVIVQDTDKQPFEGKWYPVKEAETLIAKRDKAAKS